ncbi:MAG: 2-amino-4-hydroxy-6-hydroxymethyldihydropteridine diphosphokinase [Planctomycetes bacterium]|nr:2-amino-4-hydroxy-6-hydroxymethyldihydropteridine diphosphokinase [Planctomycetota bacterium]
MMAQALVSLGANLGDRSARLVRAVAAVGASPWLQLATRSPWHETAPVGGPAGQPAFLNGAMLLETSRSPQELLNVLMAIEKDAGRRRETQWDARTLDLDLLLYDDVVLDTLELTLPHARMAYRRFVLAPACEAAPQMQHPLIGWTVRRLLDHLNHTPHYLAITGPPGAGKTQLAERVAENSGAVFCADPFSEKIADCTIDEARARITTRGAALEQALAGSTSGVVSDFWIEQSRACVDGLPEDGFASSPAARLVVIVEPSVCGDATPGNVDAEDYAAKLRRLATCPGRGPYLVVGLDDFEHAVREASAAMLAMR